MVGECSEIRYSDILVIQLFVFVNSFALLGNIYLLVQTTLDLKLEFFSLKTKYINTKREFKKNKKKH